MFKYKNIFRFSFLVIAFAVLVLNRGNFLGSPVGFRSLVRILE